MTTVLRVIAAAIALPFALMGYLCGLTIALTKQAYRDGRKDVEANR